MTHLDVDRLMRELSAILSEKYGAKVTISVRPVSWPPSWPGC